MNIDKTELATLRFRDRASYVKWRADWRLEYRRLSGAVREEKDARRKAGEHGAPHQARREALRVVLRSMMEMRAASKLKAGKLRERDLKARLPRVADGSNAAVAA